MVFVLVVAALLWGVFRRRASSEDPTAERTERSLTRSVATATAVTVVILFVFLVLDISVGRAVTASPGPGALSVRVTGHQWWWEVQYPDSVANNCVTAANEIHVPVGRPVLIELRSTDVIHSFWLPNLQRQARPDPRLRRTVSGSEPTRPGVYRGQCAEFCGHQHANMALLVVAEPPRQLRPWLAQQRRHGPHAGRCLARRGQEVFLAATCVMCHTIAGTPAGSRVGPDLTHLASRQHDRRRHAAQHPRQSGRLDRGPAADQAGRPDAAESAQSVGPASAAGVPGEPR